MLLAVADHYEPYWGGADQKRALARVASWRRHLPDFGAELRDSRGRGPQHTFFYPQDEYDPLVLDQLAAMRGEGLGEVEVHIHHQGETSAQLEQKLLAYADLLHHRHGLLRVDPHTGGIAYGFVHGNWALDNSRPDGLWCGVNDELKVLARSGCYADFTLPSAPSPTQTHTVNSIYYAKDDPQRPKSHDRGRPSQVGSPPWGDLLLVQGVLALDWGRRKWGCLPRLENSDLAGHLPPSPSRARLWVKHSPLVEGEPRVRFIKLSCHGAPEQNHQALWGPAARQTWQWLLDNYNRPPQRRLFFVTCWEMVQAVHALEQGADLEQILTGKAGRTN